MSLQFYIAVEKSDSGQKIKLLFYFNVFLNYFIRVLINNLCQKFEGKNVK